MAVASTSYSNSSSAATAVAEHDSYPAPVSNFVKKSLSVSENNYSEWRRQMYGLIKRKGLVGFINGTVEAPARNVTVPDDGGEIENEDYRTWKSSDAQLREWIRTTLAGDIPEQVVRCRTAKAMWTKLEQMFGHYVPLHKATIEGDWNSTNEFIKQEPDFAIRAGITEKLETALIVAVKSKQRNHFARKLMEQMSPEDVTLSDSRKRTALHRAAGAGNLEAAKLLVNKNPYLANAQTYDNRIPLFFAAARGNRKMVLYLLNVTVDEAKPNSTHHLSRSLFHSLAHADHLLTYSRNKKLLEDDTRKWKKHLRWNPTPFEGESGFRILHQLTFSGLYDIALALLQDKPKLAFFIPEKEEDLQYHSLMAIAQKPSSFRSGTSFNFFHNFICSLPCIKHIREHHQALELVKFICNEIVKSNYSNASKIFLPPLFQATSVGIHEIVEVILRSYPDAIHLQNKKKQSIFHQAIVWRRENVFNLIHQVGESKTIFLSQWDESKNNALHLAGYLAPQQRLYLRAGAALQMQRELQWFKEVENHVVPRNKEERNKKGKLPAEVFTDTHKNLVKEGEQWMKDTANACSIVAALIATVVFAAAITVPGGNNSDGLPFFYKRAVFLIFGIFDALALFLSITSVLLFLSILTSRYGENDFLVILPRRLIFGLVTLFLSILSTMIAFGATLYLVFGDRYKEWIIIPIVVLSSIPVALFVFLQFPLLLDIFKSTCCSIFVKQSDHMLH